jgi:hypothetical protein
VVVVVVLWMQVAGSSMLAYRELDCNKEGGGLMPLFSSYRDVS